LSLVEKHIVVPYRKTKRGPVAEPMRQASSAESARRIAATMADHCYGVAAYAVSIDEETGYMNSPVMLSQFGEVPELEV
jgi:hypothetical protein